MDYVGAKGIETSCIASGGNRIGTYYLPQGADLKNAGVIYDRAYSSFWSLTPGQIDWDMVLEDISWFHFSAISPALNENVAAVCLEAVQAASRKGITVSIDLNYREKLWQWGKRPDEVMPQLVEHCNVVMGNIWAAEKMLSIPLPEELKDDQQAYLDQAQKTSEEMIRSFPKCNQVANTFRFDRGEGVHYYATLFNGDELYVSDAHDTNYIIDKVGSGDTFMGALIYGNFRNLPPKEKIDFAAAAAFNKLFIKGDATTASVEDIKQAFSRYA